MSRMTEEPASAADNVPYYLRELRQNLEKNPRTCCDRKLPTQGKIWELVWPRKE